MLFSSLKASFSSQILSPFLFIGRMLPRVSGKYGSNLFLIQENNLKEGGANRYQERTRHEKTAGG